MDLEKLVEKVTRLVLAEMQDRKPCKTALVFTAKKNGVPESVSAVLDGDWQVVYPVDVYEYSRVDRFILPELKIDQMVDLASGRSGLRMMSRVREILLSGRQVEVVEFEYRKYLKSAPPALVSLYKEYHRRLQSFGMIESDCPKDEQSTFLLEGLVTEADVQVAHEQGIQRLEVGKGCRLTPLAGDYVREHRMTLIHHQEGKR